MSEKDEKKIKKAKVHWHDVLLNEFKGESDRACVILAASLLDNALLALLQSKLAPCAGSNDALFDGANAPLSTFSSRIDASYRLGLISARFCRDLHLVRRIRNEFAHNVTGCSFDESAIRDRVQALANSSRFASIHESWHCLYPDTPKGHFQFAVGWMQWCIRDITEDTVGINPAAEEWGYTTDFETLTAPDA
jgi:DNA-binding MltR family transcriptional regulator